MRVRQSIMVVMLLAGGLAAAVGNARAAALADANLFGGQTVASSSYYNGMSGFITTNAVDATSAAFILSDPGADPSQLLQVRGFNSAINTLRFFSWSPGSSRASASVGIYYSSALNDTDPLNLANYTFLKTSALATLPSDINSTYAASSADGYYSDATNLGIPAGTQSVLLNFGPQVTSAYGAAMNEVQAFAAARIDDQNLLSGKPVTASSFYLGMPAFDPSHITDGTTLAHVFDENDAQRSMAITGFDSSVGLIRVWRDGDRVPDTVTIASTTVADSINPSDYAALTSVTGLRSMFNAEGYADIPVNAPAGTKGLGFLWGPGDNAPGARLQEIQAFAGAPVPEPSTVVMLACGLVSLLAYAWRKRK
jgi:hypothetical protein